MARELVLIGLISGGALVRAFGTEWMRQTAEKERVRRDAEDALRGIDVDALYRNAITDQHGGGK